MDFVSDFLDVPLQPYSRDPAIPGLARPAIFRRLPHPPLFPDSDSPSLPHFRPTCPLQATGTLEALLRTCSDSSRPPTPLTSYQPLPHWL